MKSNDRTYVIVALFLFVTVIFIARLFYVQIVQDSWKVRAIKITERAVTNYPSRGLIYDRNNKVLVGNTAVYDLMVVPKNVESFDTTLFCKITELEKEEFKKKFKKARKYSRYKPSILIAQIPAYNYADIAENLDQFKGFYGVPNTMRIYPDSAAPHAVGFVSEVNAKKVKDDAYYHSGDYIGDNGIELQYEEVLRGKKGVSFMLVDVHNNVKGKYSGGSFDTASVSGQNLVSTIDLDLQIWGELLMSKKRGSIVAIEPKTGEILAMVNNPSYNPNVLIGRQRSKNYSALNRDTLKPLFNRALQAQYPPGSTFKLLNALIGLEEGVVTPNTYHSCYGGYFFGRRKLGCHPHSSPLNLKYSITTSCNAYYCNVFKNIIDKYPTAEEGYQVWRNYVSRFGLGSKLNLDLTDEKPGILKPTTYYDEIYGKGSWKPHTVISLSIGQGELGVTPMQMANYTATIANRGYYYTPHIIKQIGDSVIDLKSIDKFETGISEENFEIVIDAMENVIDHGTGRGVKYDETKICGKTGTAQNPHGKDHSIFIAFAPKNDPQIAVAVYVENVGYGSTWAAPITSLIIEKYLTRSTNRPLIEKKMLEADLLKEN
ncbi:MAG: penicillin-binding protein 2 [Patiriisocius sp.]|jgi:penicillin-binding protein 2